MQAVIQKRVENEDTKRCECVGSTHVKLVLDSPRGRWKSYKIIEALGLKINHNWTEDFQSPFDNITR